MRHIDPLGTPIDGLGDIESEERRALEIQAPGVMLRQPVKEPLATGIKAIDALTPVGQQRVAAWLADVSWPKPDLAEFHLKLIAAATARLADPIAIVYAQRRELLRRLRDAQRAAMTEPDRSAAALLVEGIVLRLRADLQWLEACERTWTGRREES